MLGLEEHSALRLPDGHRHPEGVLERDHVAQRLLAVRYLEHPAAAVGVDPLLLEAIAQVGEVAIRSEGRAERDLEDSGVRLLGLSEEGSLTHGSRSSALPAAQRTCPARNSASGRS